jgi:hypothetical protein
LMVLEVRIYTIWSLRLGQDFSYLPVFVAPHQRCQRSVTSHVCVVSLSILPQLQYVPHCHTLCVRCLTDTSSDLRSIIPVAKVQEHSQTTVARRNGVRVNESQADRHRQYEYCPLVLVLE